MLRQNKYDLYSSDFNFSALTLLALLFRKPVHSVLQAKATVSRAAIQIDRVKPICVWRKKIVATV